jgi:DNA-binding transcriptional MerR regulator
MTHGFSVRRYKLDELAREAEITPRTVRYYVQRGLVPPPDFRGSHTTYGPEHLLRLRVIRHLQLDHVPLDAIQARIAGADETELARMLERGPTLGGPSSDAAPRAASPYRTPGAEPRAERWERWELVPGVELHVRGDAGPHARTVARKIQQQYGDAVPFAPEESS